MPFIAFKCALVHIAIGINQHPLAMHLVELKLTFVHISAVQNEFSVTVPLAKPE